MTAAADAARSALAAGVSICPPREDGTKAPITAWKSFQYERATPEQVDEWYSGDRAGVGVICGAVSGGLELLEMDTADILADYIAAAKAAGIFSLLSRVAAGYYETTPHGHHLFYRVDGAPVPGNTKLARRPKTPEEQQHEHDNVQTLIETRGTGGFVVVAPSSGTVHPTGKPYTLMRGGWDTLATITPAERDQLHDLARTFDVPLLATPLPSPRTERQSPGSGESRPGDDYNVRGSIFELMERHGWAYIGLATDGNHQWRRPGKSDGISATWKDDQFWCWTTSSAFEAERTYTLFGVYTVLECGGDFTESTRKLAAEGYGSSGERAPRQSANPHVSTTPVAPGGWQPTPGVKRAVSLSNWLTGAA